MLSARTEKLRLLFISHVIKHGAAAQVTWVMGKSRGSCFKPFEGEKDGVARKGKRVNSQDVDESDFRGGASPSDRSQRSGRWEEGGNHRLGQECSCPGQGQGPTFLGHAHFKALLESAVLAAIPGHLVDDTVFVAVTCVHHVLLDAAAEEALELGVRGTSVKQDADSTNLL